MRKEVLLLLLVIACAPAVVPRKDVPAPLVQPLEITLPVPLEPPRVTDQVIRQSILSFDFVGSGSALDSFGIVRADRFDANYSSVVNVSVHVFGFGSRSELEYALNQEFFDIL